MTKVSPMAGRILSICARVYSMDILSDKSWELKAQVSTTWEPWVLMRRMLWPFETRAALPSRAGMTCRADMVENV